MVTVADLKRDDDAAKEKKRLEDEEVKRRNDEYNRQKKKDDLKWAKECLNGWLGEFIKKINARKHKCLIIQEGRVWDKDHHEFYGEYLDHTINLDPKGKATKVFIETLKAAGFKSTLFTDEKRNYTYVSHGGDEYGIQYTGGTYEAHGIRIEW